MHEDKSEYIRIDDKIYRKNVGIILFNKEGKVLLCERRQKKSHYKWNFPQGGVDIGEETKVTAVRELVEETGITSVKINFEDDVWRVYDFPLEFKPSRLNIKEHYKYVIDGQIQKWFLLEFLGNDEEIKIPSDEFISYKWVDFTRSIVNSIIPFKRGVYKSVIKKIRPVLEDFMKSK